MACRIYLKIFLNGPRNAQDGNAMLCVVYSRLENYLPKTWMISLSYPNLATV
jgi:hypothetical protein